jgi:ubiquitin-protein ligase
MSHGNTIKRLAREYQELLACPVRDISVKPLNDENLMEEWHGNIQAARVEGNDWPDIVVHFVITFPNGYPSHPPKVHLCSFVPHLNVITTFQGRFEVCLDMLDKPSTRDDIPTIPYQNWSSAFSIRSILVQLSSFLLCPGQPLETSAGGMTRTLLEAGRFVCSAEGCSHCHDHPQPALPTDAQVDAAPLSFPSVEVSGQGAQVLQARIFSRRVQQQQQLMLVKRKTGNESDAWTDKEGREGSSLENGVESGSCNSIIKEASSSGIGIEAVATEKVTIVVKEPMPAVKESEWQLVKGREAHYFASASTTASASSSSSPPSPLPQMARLSARALPRGSDNGRGSYTMKYMLYSRQRLRQRH